MFRNSYVENLLQRILDRVFNLEIKLNELKNSQDKCGDDEREPWIRISKGDCVIVDRPAAPIQPYNDIEVIYGQVDITERIKIDLYWRDKGSKRRWF